MGCDPIVGIATIAMDTNNPIELRARCFFELMPYLYPKRKPVDSSMESPTSITVETKIENSKEAAHGVSVPDD